MLVSELVSKKIIALSSAEEIGVIANVLFDDNFTRGKYLHVLCESESRPENCYVSIRKIFAVKDALILKNDDDLIYEWEPGSAKLSPINRTAFSHEGELLGRVLDVEIDGDKVKEIVTEKASFEPKKLLSTSDDILVFNTSDKPIKLPQKKVSVKCDDRKIVLHEPERPSPRQNNESAPQNTAAEITATKTVEKTHIPVPALIPQKDTTVTRSPISHYPFLIGKPVHAAVTEAGNVIIPAGTIVTEEVIELAKQHGKLVQLALRAY